MLEILSLIPTITITNYIFDREEFLVIFKGRKIGLRIDPSVGINIEDIIGKTFEV